MKLTFLLATAIMLSVVFTSCDKEDDVVTDIPDIEVPTPPTEQPENSENGTDNNPDAPDTPDDTNNSGDTDGEIEENKGKTLVVYFSRTGYNYPNQWLDVGHTARVAGYIIELTGGDSFEIIPEVPYPDDYEETKAIATREHNSNARPAIKSKLENINDYDTVFIGHPIWMGAAPMIIHTFYESYNLTGKVIIPFTTHAGSGLGDAERLARSYYPDNTILSGLAVQGTQADNSKGTVESWLRRIGIIK